MLHKRLSLTAPQAAWAKDKRSTRMRAEACAIDNDDDDNDEEEEAYEGQDEMIFPELKVCGCYSATILIRAGSHEVPSPTHVSKSQRGGKVPTFEPQETIEIFLIII
jgi:hypothetical protein